MFGRSVFMGTTRFQHLWGRLHLLALQGMNIGAGDQVRTSGERLVLELVASRLLARERAKILDVGANVGEYAQEALDVLGERVSLVCFEPSPVAFNRLTARHASRPGITLANTGLGDAEGMAQLYGDAAGSPLGSLYPRHLDRLGIDFAPTEEVRITTLDTYCQAEGIRRIHLLKLDAEGHELRILHGARNLIEAGAIDLVQFEFGGTCIDARNYLRDFVEFLGERYDLHRIVADGLVPIGPYREVLEVFLTTNYLGVLRERAAR